MKYTEVVAEIDKVNAEFNSGLTELFNKVGGFFAFSKEQFEASKVEGVTYANAELGLILPVNEVDEYRQGFKKISDDRHEKMMKLVKENKIYLIQHELVSRECYYSGTIHDAMPYLEEYGITVDDVLAVFNKGEPSFLDQ